MKTNKYCYLENEKSPAKPTRSPHRRNDLPDGQPPDFKQLVPLFLAPYQLDGGFRATQGFCQKTDQFPIRHRVNRRSRDSDP